MTLFQPYTGTRSGPGHFQLETFVVCWVTISVVIFMLPCFISFCSALSSFSHSSFLLWLFSVPQMLLQNLLLSSVPGFSLLSIFPFSCWYTLFWSCWNNLFILYRSVLWPYLLILVALACILCFSSSRTTFNTFIFVLYYFIFLFLFNFSTFLSL